MDIFTSLDKFIDTTISGGALKVAAALAVPSAEFLTVLAGGSLAVWAVTQAFRGSFSLDGLINFVVRFGLLYSLVAGTAVWTGLVYPYISDLGPNVGNFLINNFGGDVSAAGGIVSAMAGFVDTVISAAWEAISSIGSWDAFWDASGSLGVILFGILAVIGALIVGIVSMIMIIIAKVILAVLLAVTPFLAVWAFLKSTASVFDSWVKGVIMLTFFQILVYGTLGIIMAASQTMSAAAAGGILSGSEASKELMKFILLSGVAIGGLAMTPMLARTLGGASIDLGRNAITENMRKGRHAGAAMLGQLFQKSSSKSTEAAGHARNAASQAVASAPGNAAPKSAAANSDQKRAQTAARRHG